jgi:hypothetical protein
VLLDESSRSDLRLVPCSKLLATKLWIRIVAVLGLSLMVACSGARLEIRNQSSSRLHDVTIVATGTSVAVGSIEPSASKISSICPKGEAGSLRISFRAGDKVFQSDKPLYFECNAFYRIRVDVSPVFEPTVVHDFK